MDNCNFSDANLTNIDLINYLNDFRGHLDIVNSVAVNNENSYVVSGSNDCTIKVWDNAYGNEK